MKRLVLALFMLVGCTRSNKCVDVVEKSLPKTVMIYVSTVIKQTTLVLKNNSIEVHVDTVPVTLAGSGVIVSPTGHVVTCAHLFTEGKRGLTTVCLYDGTCEVADVLYGNEQMDLALLKINEDHPLPYAKLGREQDVKIGQDAIAIGNPLGFEFSVTRGIVSGLNVPGMGLYNFTQTDAAINPGNSGGPLFNMDGELIGINSRIMSPVKAPIFTGLAFSVSISEIRQFLDEFRGLEHVYR